MATAARVLWTKQVRKKSKTYNDGFLLISASGQAATLYDEGGKELSAATGKLPYGLAANPAAAEDLAVFEGFLVQGDSPCDPADISAVRGCSSNDSALSTSTHHASTHSSMQQQGQHRAPVGFVQPGMGPAAATAPSAPPKAPALLGRKLTRHGATGAAGPAGTAARPGTGFKVPAGTGPSLNQQHHHHQQQQQGQQGSLWSGQPQQQPSTGMGLAAAGMHSGATSCAPTLQSDDDILQLLDSIAPAGSDTWACQQQQQQPPQQQLRSLPAVPQFGRSQQRKQPQQQQLAGPSLPNQEAGSTAAGWQQQQQAQTGQSCQQPKQQWHQHPQPGQLQQRWPGDKTNQQQQQQQQQDESACVWAAGWVQPAAAPAEKGAAGAAAFQSARNAWAAPHSSAESSSMQARQPLHPVQPVQQQQQQWRQQQARTAWQQKQQQPLPAASQGAGGAEGDGTLAHISCAGGGTAPAAAAPNKVSLQQRAAFKLPRPIAAAGGAAASGPAGALAGGGALPHRQQQQQQQQGLGKGEGYFYPGPTAAGPVRTVQVPTGFTTPQQYVSTLAAALTEEVNLQLAEQARSFYSIVGQVQSGGPAGAGAGKHQGSFQQGRQQQFQQQKGPQHQQWQQRQQQHQRQGQGSKQAAAGGGADLASRLQGACARAGLHYHPGASLSVYNNNSSGSNSSSGRGGWGGWGKNKKRGRGKGWEGEEEGEEGLEGEAAAPKKASSMYLTLPGKLDRRQFRKHDLWVLSNHPLLKAAAAAADSSGPYDRLSQPWVVLARSCWHGPDRDGKMEVELLPGQQQQLPHHHKWQRQQPVTALQGPDVATDVQMGAFISSTDIRQWGLLASLLRPWGTAAQAAGVQDPAAGPAAAAEAAAAAGSTGVGVGPGLLDGVPVGRSSSSPKGCSPEAGGQQECGPSSPADSGSSQELLAVRRRKRRMQLSDDSSSSEGEDDSSSGGGDGVQQGKAAAGPTQGHVSGPDSSSDWEDDFEPVAARRPDKRARTAAAAAGAAGAAAAAAAGDAVAAAADASMSSDSEEEDPDLLDAGVSTTPAAAAAAGAGAATAGVTAASDVAAAAQQLLAQVVQRFRLNPAQAAVAEHVASWLPQLMQDVRQRQQQGKRARSAGRFRGPALAAGGSAGTSVATVPAGSTGGAVEQASSSSRAPVCLIHGPFGSGKSTLLCALIHLLTGLAEQQEQGAKGSSRKQQQQQPPTPRILVAAHTNVAVDRVLLGLQEAGFTNMLRVGSLARIAKQLLGVSLHSADDSRDALSQLNSMLPNAAGAEAQMIRSEIAAIQAGAERRRRKALSTTAVVGITCCSALQSTLEGQVFDVVLLDEASQMTEPTSLVPLLRAMPRYLIAAGDPCQLPPVLASPTGVTQAAAAAAAAAAHGTAAGASSSSRPSGQLQQQQQQQQQQGAVVYGLLRPLFVRLTHLGHVPHLLTHQYRCHPMLSLLSNKHFYNSRLVDGVTAAQRSPLLPGLPPLVLCDCQGGASQAAGGGSRSSINRAEANLVAQLVARLLQATAGGSRGEGQGRQQQQQQQQEGEGDQQQEGEEPSCGSDSDDAAPPALAAHQLGVICFFRGQAALIKQMITADASCPSAADVQVATVDSFQGAEKEVIILATTTTNPRSEFCSDGARLNVALTRARRHLVVVGAAGVLAKAPSAVLRELVTLSRSGQQAGAVYMPGGSLLQLLAPEQQ